MIPKDPMILLSYVNTQLRDYYDSLEALCTCRGLKKDELVAKMHSIDYEYPFCKYICPLGALYSIFNPVSLYKYRVDKDKCIKCGKCAKHAR